MAKICYLASQVTLPASPMRRSDAFEHDYTIETLKPALADKSIGLDVVSWDAPDVDWTQFDLVMIGTTWDYWDKPDVFLERLDLINSQTQLHNPIEIVRWNSDKRYLKALADLGCRTIPTLWFENLTLEALTESYKKFGSDIVAKRQIGAGAAGQFRIRQGDPLPSTPHPMMVQPFLPSIQTEGEYSFIFIDGKLSHALVKKAKTGDYRIQSSYGGYEEIHQPDAQDLAAAHAVLEHIAPTLLYARVDMVRSPDDGALCLMEIELIEPYLYPEQGSELGRLLAEAIAAKLTS